MIDLESRIDLHVHTTISDGTDTPEKITEKAREAGLSLFAVTDHDAVKGCGIVIGLLRKGDPHFLSGVEFSCKDELGRYHILGYGYDPDSGPVRQIAEEGHARRVEKLKERLHHLKLEFGITFPEEEIERLFALDNPGKPHLANLLVKMGYAKSRGEAFHDILNRLRVRSHYFRPEEVIRAILEGEGIPVLAHPSYGNGDQIIVGREMEDRLKRLIGFGIQGVEGFYSGFTDKLTAEILSFAEDYHLYVTAGSDYHGSNKMISLGETGIEYYPELPMGYRRFLTDTECKWH